MKLKSAKLKTSVINTALLAIVLIIVIFQLYAAVVPEAQSAGDSMGNTARCEAAGGYWNANYDGCYNGTGVADTTAVAYTAIPLSAILGGTGVVFVIIMAALIILVVRSFMQKGK